MKSIFFLSVIISIIIFISQVAFADHPALGQPTGNLKTFYSQEGLPPEWSLGDIVFSPANMKPAPEELTEIEKYIVAGTTSTAYNAAVGHKPWRTELLIMTDHFNGELGYIPEVLSGDAIRMIPGYGDMTDEDLALYRSPITGEWPKLNAYSDSPGDVYIRPLTMGEKAHFAELNPTWNRRWFERILADPIRGCDRDIDYITPVYYVRIYGEEKVLVEILKYFMLTYD